MNPDMRIRENSKLLEKIAMGYPTKSIEHQALKMSAFAFGYVMLHHEKDFDKYVQHLHKPLNKKRTPEDSETKWSGMMHVETPG